MAKARARTVEFPLQFLTADWDTRKVSEDDDKRKTYDVSVSSEREIERSSFGMGGYVEVLEHSEAAVDLSRLRAGAPVLLEHDPHDQIGVIERAYLQDRTLRVVMRFSKNPHAQEIERDVEDGIRRNLSIGYMVRKVKVEGTEERKKYRALRWQPGEVSVVSIPADVSVGVNRAGKAHTYPVEIEPAGEVRKMDEGMGKPAGDGEISVEVQASLNGAEIRSLCDANGVPGEADGFIRAGKSPAEVAHVLLQRFGRETRRASVSVPAVDAGKPVDQVDGLPHRDRKRYSYARAIQIAGGMMDGSAKFDGLEAEVHQHLVKSKPQSQQLRSGILVPTDMRGLEDQWAEREKRALDSKTVTKGSEVVFEVPGELIDLLRNRAAAAALGARIMTGLSGPVTFPKQTGAGTAVWVGENPASPVAASDLALGVVMLTPKTLQSTTSYSRQLLVQSSVDVENMVRNDLAQIHALAIDRAAFHGSGVGGEPTGIYKAPDTFAKAMGGAVSFAELVDMIGNVADKNATFGTLGWVTTPLMAARLRVEPEHATLSTGSWVWQGTLEIGGTGTIAGYRAVATSQISKLMSGSEATGGSEHGIIFGNWAELVIGMFGALELVVDPYSAKKFGMLEVTSFNMTDCIVRHGESFAKATGATLA